MPPLVVGAVKGRTPGQERGGGICPQPTALDPQTSPTERVPPGLHLGRHLLFAQGHRWEQEVQHLREMAPSLSLSLCEMGQQPLPLAMPCRDAMGGPRTDSGNA